MSSALADLLIELSDPEKLEEFTDDPDRVMMEANLTEADKAALRSKKSGWIKYQAKSTTENPEDLIGHEGDITGGIALDVIEVITATDVIIVL
jgi:hypothetical protein